jgi:hypothetical protein
MSTPTGDNAFLYTLELNVRADLIQAETGQPEEEAVGVPIDEWLVDPADAQRYEVGLRNLLGAVEALEDGSGPGGYPPPAEAQESVITAWHLAHGRGGRASGLPRIPSGNREVHDCGRTGQGAF